jgi:hypothetical protein
MLRDKKGYIAKSTLNSTPSRQTPQRPRGSDTDSPYLAIQRKMHVVGNVIGQEQVASYHFFEAIILL